MSNLSDFVGGAPALWASGKTYPQGKFAISPTDFNTYIRKIAGAGATDPASDATNWQPIGAGGIKSIQRGTVVGTTTSVTISAVNMAKTELRSLGGVFLDSGAAFKTVPQFALSSSTTIAVNGNGSYTKGSGSWELTERY